MRRFLAFVLIVLIAFGTSVRSAFASSDHKTRQVERLKNKLESLSLGSHLQVHLNDHSQVAGVLVAHSEEGIELAAPESVALSYSEIKTLAADDYGQSTSGQNQNPSVHHRHHVRNFLIVFGAGAVLLVVLAAAAK
jgi:hypothetical protein